MKPYPPASATAAASAGVDGPPAIGAWTIGSSLSRHTPPSFAHPTTVECVSVKLPYPAGKPACRSSTEYIIGHTKANNSSSRKGATMTAAGAAISDLATVAPRQRASSRASVASQIKNQRRVYARAVVRTLARTHQGRPTVQIQRVLRESLTPLGVRLPNATLHQLAADIAAGRPAELP